MDAWWSWSVSCMIFSWNKLNKMDGWGWESLTDTYRCLVVLSNCNKSTFSPLLQGHGNGNNSTLAEGMRIQIRRSLHCISTTKSNTCQNVCVFCLFVCFLGGGVQTYAILLKRKSRKKSTSEFPSCPLPFSRTALSVDRISSCLYIGDLELCCLFPAGADRWNRGFMSTAINQNQFLAIPSFCRSILCRFLSTLFQMTSVIEWRSEWWRFESIYWLSGPTGCAKFECTVLQSVKALSTSVKGVNGNVYRWHFLVSFVR